MINQQNHYAFCTVSAPAKAILTGQHAVVYGKDAIAIAIGLHCTATLFRRARKAATSQMVIHSSIESSMKIEADLLAKLASIHSSKQNYSYDQFEKDLLSSQHPIWSHYQQSTHFKLSLLLKEENVDWQVWQKQSPFDYLIDVRSDIPIGKCLGSSAAFNTALATAVLIILGRLPIGHLSSHYKEKINKISVRFESVEHGTPSGIDNFVSVHGGVILYNRNKEPRFVEVLNAANNIKHLLNVGIIDTGIEKNTKVAVSNVRQKYQSAPQYKAMIEEIGEISVQAAVIIGKSECSEESIDRLLSLISRNHILLRDLGVSHPKIQQIVEEWEEKGWSGKITGSGMGGCVLLLSHRQNTHQQGVQIVQIDQYGLRVVPVSQSQ